MPSPLLPITNPSSHHHASSLSSLASSPASAVFGSKNGGGGGGRRDDDPIANLLISSPFDDEKAASVRPLLSRTSSYASAGVAPAAAAAPSSGLYQQRRRRSASENSLSSMSDNGRHQPLGREVADATSTRFGWRLLKYLGLQMDYKISCSWCYSLLLMPGFVQVGYYYFFSSQVRRGIVYGDLPRNSYKAWGSLLGQQLSERDIIVACIDYRNFPQVTIGDMVKDASQGISFVCNHIAEYGGDPNRVYLMGQSAGAHIAACALLEQAIKECGEGESTSWSVSQIKAYFGLSGGYNLLELVDYFHSRGLYRSLFLGIMEGEQSLQRYSPDLVARDPNIRTAVSRLPPVILFHGTADYSIPSDASKNFAETLGRAGVNAEAILYKGKTHTDLFLQDPMRGGKDDMLEDLVGYIHAADPEARAKDAAAPPRRRMVPEYMLKLARAVSPF
ncbi:hypothetical protein ACJRO7_012273 [Eucalyptus globulus]|uniref:protein-S-isoprenylcysteine alpha-carbonyl methylesterase n=1 Tax=Eucalyptus globulus TaxID=34317 RepID=A0ABD3LI11_EUCGL